jgi:predicted membrane protein
MFAATTLITAAVLILLTFYVADSLWTFIKVGLIFTALWFMMFIVMAVLMGIGGTVGTVVAYAINLALLGMGLWLGKAVTKISQARKHPERYLIADKHCGECGRMIMKDPWISDDKQPFEHIYKPDTPHKVVIADGPPEWLPPGVTLPETA